jgi:hypothetical protein
MNSISFACPSCSGVFQVAPQQNSSQVYCPHCEKVIDLPTQATHNEAPQGTPTSDIPEPNSKTKKRRASKKPQAPETNDTKDLFPPGYVAESSTTAPADPKPVPATLPNNPTTSVTPTSSTSTRNPTTSKPAANLSEPGAELPRPTNSQAVQSTSATDSLLPPGISDGSTASSNSPVSSLPSTDHLLPPAVSAGEPKDDLFSGIDSGNNATMDGSSEEHQTPQIALLEPVRTVEKHGQEIELKQRTPEEKLRWKLRKNLVLWISGILILLITLYVMKN